MAAGFKINNESGNRWEVRRSYLTNKHAEMIAQQARWLMNQTAYCLSVQRHNALRKGTLGILSATLHLEGSTRNRGLPTLERYPDIEEATRLITDLYTKTSIETCDTARAVSILRYAPFGRLGWHRDETKKSAADNTLAITLGGHGIVVVKDELQGSVAVPVYRGDAMFIDNSGNPEERVEHMAYNLGTKQRIVYVD